MIVSLEPARAVLPGRILEQELVARRWSLNDLARTMNYPDRTLQKLIEDSEPITWEIAQKLAQALGTSTEFWVNLEGNYLSMAPPQSTIC